MGVSHPFAVYIFSENGQSHFVVGVAIENKRLSLVAVFILSCLKTQLLEFDRKRGA
jgi:hypothetical protein